MTIPHGATHFQTFYGIVSFYKYAYHFTGVESGTQYQCWHGWTGKEWKPESGFRDVNMRPIGELDYP